MTTDSSTGQDFVLFEQNPSLSFGSSPAATSFGGINFTNQNGNPAFTEYRSGSTVAQNDGRASLGGTNDSPFSSPATRPDEDASFGSMGLSAPRMGSSSLSLDALPSSSNTAASPIASDLSQPQGRPRQKRARAHGHSTSWAGDNLQNHLQQQLQSFQRHRHRQQQQQQHMQSQGPGLQSHSQQGTSPAMAASSNLFGMSGVPMSTTQSFGGFPTNQGSGSDWSGSDTSPRAPPSGSLGPPIHSLSLGDGSSDGMQSLFPASNATNSPYTSSLSAARVGNGSSTASQQQQDLSFQAAALAAAIQQEDRARQQIRADLQGVDSRALKGQLRDIQQGANTGSPSMGSLSMTTDQGNVLFPNVPTSKSLTQVNLEAMQDQSGQEQSRWQSSTPQGPSEEEQARRNSMQDMMDPNFYNAVTAAAALNNASAPTSSSGQDAPATQIDFEPDISIEQVMSANPGGLKGDGTQTSNGSVQHPTPPRRFSDRTQAAIDRARMQVPSRKRMVREGSGLTISPQEAFLDYNNIDSMLQASQPSGKRPSYPSLFGPVAPGFAKQPADVDTPRASVNKYKFNEGTPSLADASSTSSNDGSEVRTVASSASPAQRMSLNRGDTVMPSAAQREQLKQREQMQSSQKSTWSKGDPSLFSPSESNASSTDDEDEKPYLSKNPLQQRQGMQAMAPSAMQSGNFASGVGMRTPQPGQRTNYTMNSGPRFSFVSSSSSESDEDSQRVDSSANQGSSQGSVNRPRTMGGYGYMGSSTESGLSAVPPTSQVSMPTTSFNLPPEIFSAEKATQGLSQAGFFPTTGSNPTPHFPNHAEQRMGWSAPSEASSQSQDEGPSLSPSIRSSAQPIVPGQGVAVQGAPTGFGPAKGFQQGIPLNVAQFGGALPAAQASVRGSPQVGTAASSEDSMDEDTEDDEASAASDGSTYREAPKSKSGGGRRSSAAVARKRRSQDQARRGSAGLAAAATAGGDGLTVCDYVSPITRETCGTEFHRPYDLARHRETIHAREEAMLLKQGQITKEQCNVLYKEVDPAKSLATVEWRCDGPHGCGALFSRKDALLRHRRIRNH